MNLIRRRSFASIATLGAWCLLWREASAQPTGTNTPSVNVGPAGTALLGQIPGSVTNDSANTGNIGEFQTANLTAAGALVLASGGGTTVVGVSLTAGDWDVWGAAVFKSGSLTVSTIAAAGLTTSASSTLPGLVSGAGSQVGFGAGLTGIADTAVSVGPARISLSATATAFVQGNLTFGTSTASVYGIIQARRRR